VFYWVAYYVAVSCEEVNKMLDGTWLPITAELGGRKLPYESLKTMKLFLIGGRYVAKVGNVMDQGVLKLDLKTTPKTMDITGTNGPNEGKTIQAIYELKGDSLTVCYAPEGKVRPSEFRTSADSNLYLVTYKRVYP